MHILGKALLEEYEKLIGGAGRRDGQTVNRNYLPRPGNIINESLFQAMDMMSLNTQ